MTIVDVRMPDEFASGHVEGSINIPVKEIPNRIAEFRSFSQPLYLCCASGNRSGQGTRFLQAQGIKCENAGSWIEAMHIATA